METLELFFNNEDENAIYESWCFEPEPLQERDLGNLYVIAKLEGKDSTSLNYLASSISNAYSSQKSLESAVKTAKKIIKERGLTNLEIAILIEKDKNLTFTKTDETEVALLRNKEVINIGSKVKGHLSNVGTVELKAKDKILAITSEAWRELRQKHLISKTASHYKKQPIKETLTSSEASGVALMIILQPKLFEDLGNTFTNFFKGMTEALSSSIKNIKQRLPRFSKPSDDSFLYKKLNAAWPERKAQETPFLIGLSYLISFIAIRLLVFIVGSVNSPVAQAVKESSSIFHFHIGRNIILFGYHIHHFYLGILLIAIAGWLSITNSQKVSKKSMAVMYGIGLGLLMDEIGLLLTWGNYTSSLSYLLGVLLLGILLNIIYFPSFWKKVRSKAIKRKFGLSWLNKILKATIHTADKISGRN